MMNWLLPTLIALVCYGLWAFFPKVASNSINPKSVVLYNVLGAVIINIIIFFTMKSKIEWEPKGALFSFLTGIVGIVGTLFFVYALTKGKASVIIIITALYPMIAIILAAVFLKEAITIRQYLGMGLALMAMILIAG